MGPPLPRRGVGAGAVARRVRGRARTLCCSPALPPAEPSRLRLGRALFAARFSPRSRAHLRRGDSLFCATALLT